MVMLTYETLLFLVRRCVSIPSKVQPQLHTLTGKPEAGSDLWVALACCCAGRKVRRGPGELMLFIPRYLQVSGWGHIYVDLG